MWLLFMVLAFLKGRKGVDFGSGEWDAFSEKICECVLARRVAGNEAKYLAIREKFWPESDLAETTELVALLWLER